MENKIISLDEVVKMKARVLAAKSDLSLKKYLELVIQKAVSEKTILEKPKLKK